MKNKALLILSILTATCLFAAVAAAQSGGNYTITQSVIAGGGGTSSSPGNTFSVTGTAGQAAAGTVSSGGNYSIAGGFWSAANLGTITISGRVTTDGTTGLNGVTVTLSGSADGFTPTATVNNVTGYYEFTNLLSGGSYTVTPSLAGYAFNPPSQTFINTQGDEVQDFLATLCVYSLNPTSINIGPAATNGSFDITAPAGCAWTVTPNAGWLSITSSSSGSGNGTVNYSIGANSGAARVGTITVAGQTFTVNQALGHSISGTIIYGADQTKFVRNATLTATGPNTITAVTDLSGNYVLEGLTDAGNYTVTPSKTGHRNGITPFDATLILRCVAANTNCELTADQKQAANVNGSVDINGNPTISPFDATLVLRYVAAQAPNANTGEAGTWKFIPGSRPYPNLTTNPSGESYTGYLVGDVNGSWNPASNSLAEEVEAQPVTENYNQTQEQKELDEESSIRVSFPTKLSAAKGSTVLIPVLVSNKTGREISGYVLNVAFDSSVLQIDADNPIETTGTLSERGGFAVAAQTEKTGRVGIAGGGGKAFVEASGALVSLRFTVIGEANISKKAAALTLNRKSFEDAEGMPLATKSLNQKIAVILETQTTMGIGVGGRVFDRDGQGIKNALVRLVDQKGIERTVVTSDLGYYRFADVPANQSYRISVTAKKYKFTQSSQDHLVSAETNEINFVADN